MHLPSMSAVPRCPPNHPLWGFTHLQFEALLTVARQSPDPCESALVAMLGLPGLRIFEATGADIADLGKSTATECCAYAARKPRLSWSPCRQRRAGQSTGQQV